MTIKNANAENKSTVMVVDDVPANIQLLASCLTDSYVVKVATSGAQCISVIEKHGPPDILLLDIEMPGMNGYDVCRNLKRNHKTKDLPIIFITGKNSESEEEFGFGMGAVDYISKPISPVILKARIKTHITIKQQRDALISMMMFDQLTGLQNRGYFYDSATKKIAKSKRHKIELGLLLIDVDNTKRINDLHGYKKGDEVLVALAKMFTTQVRKEDCVARIGGEKFAILLDPSTLEQAVEKAKNLVELLSTTPLEGQSVTASIGVVQWTKGDDNIEQFIHRADLALENARALGGNQVRLE